MDKTTNKNLTWESLAKMISRMPSQKQKDNVCVYIGDMDEYLPVSSINFAGADNDVLDKGHMFLVTSEGKSENEHV